MKKINSNIKQKLITEYIRVENIIEFLNSLTNLFPSNEKLNKLYLKFSNIIAIYEKLFFRLNMFDLSFALLKRELSSKSFFLDISNLDISYVIEILNNLYTNLEEKIINEINDFTFNDFEKHYLIST